MFEIDESLPLHIPESSSRQPATFAICPHCSSTNIFTRDLVKHAGGAIGMVGGIASGIAGAASGAEAGAIMGIVAGPAGVAIGGLAGAIFGGLVGGISGCLTGAKLGEMIDHKVLDNYLCATCGETFSLPQS